MGARAQVKIEEHGAAVYLYTHWGAGSIVETVKTALRKKWRWTDSEYLTRIIFCQMVKGDEEGETGFGIGTGVHGDIEILVTVNVPCQTVTVKDVYGDKEQTMTFEQFIS